MNNEVLDTMDTCSVNNRNGFDENVQKEPYDHQPQNALILAAGFGMRMVPINTEISKALIEVNGEPLIERIIKQLHEVGIKEIYVVVGFRKESFEYLISSYGVKLIDNPEYATKNNLYSLGRVLNHLYNTYIVPCDIWCSRNPFSKHELYSWYMVSDSRDDESEVFVNRKMELVRTSACMRGNKMIGICYLVGEQAKTVCENILKMLQNPQYDSAFWEEALYEKDKMIVHARVVHGHDVVVINTYEQLREFDKDSNQLKSDAISAIVKALDAVENEIVDISLLKKGMTNRSFSFVCRGQKYIMRIPGAGTDKLINRAEEAAVYQTIDGKHICDDIVYINEQNGYKITAFIENARVCNPNSKYDVARCMKRLREVHNMCLEVTHEFDVFKQIDFYESLWGGRPSKYQDYKQTKAEVFSLKSYIDAHINKKVLAHIDAVPDNFLFVKNKEGREEIRLIDWEYAGMQDPHIDIAMFCIYALYDRRQVDWVIDTYFTEGCAAEIRIKIYCYVSACGLLWSNWCEYKHNLGVEFGEYSLRQYFYAKDYYQVVCRELKKGDCDNE